MHKWRNNNSRNCDKNDTSEECIDAGEYFGWLTYEWVNRAHSSQDHRRVYECVQPHQVIEVMVSDNADCQSDQGGQKRTGNVPRHTFREMAASDKLLIPALIHDKAILQLSWRS